MYNQAPPVALFVVTNIHTTPQAFGKIMSTIKPKHALAYHNFNEEETRYAVYDGVRETYDGPVSMATVTEEAWSINGPTLPPKNEADDDANKWMTKEMLEGEWDVRDAEKT